MSNGERPRQESQEQEQPEVATEGLTERFRRAINAVAEQRGRISEAISQRAEDVNFRRFVNNRYVRMAVVSLVLVGTGVAKSTAEEAMLPSPAGAEGFEKEAKKYEAAKTPREIGLEKARLREGARREDSERRAKLRKPVEAERGGRSLPTAERAVPIGDVDLETAKIDERATLEAFHFFVKYSTAEKIDENSFAVDIGGRDYHCYKITPVDLAQIRSVQEDYQAKVRDFILSKDKKPKFFAPGKLRQGFREEAERETKRIIRTYCEKIDEVSPEQVPEKIRKAQQERQKTEEAKKAKVKAQIKKERAKIK